MKKTLTTIIFLIVLLPLAIAQSRIGIKEYEKARKHWVDSVLNSLTVRQQAAQLMVKALFPVLGQDHIDKMAALVEAENIGGITFSRGGPVLHAYTVNRMRSLAKTPLMIYMDAEWGVAMRLDSVVKFPRQTTLGALQNNDLIYDMGKEIANQCKLLGIHMNFSPVVDVNNNPDNPVINSRSFGENKYKVAEKGLAYMKGMQDNGIMTSAKHFPGHGDTNVDSHASLPLISHDKKRLEDIELYPFKQFIANNVSSVMVAHLNIPAYEKRDSMPSSLSKSIVTDLLKKKLKYKGIIITDGLEMKGVTSMFPANRIPVLAFLAGNDVLLGVENPTGTLDEFEAAVERGEVSKKKLKDACRRILEMKYDAGLANFKPLQTESLVEALNSPEAVKLNNDLYANAITVLRNKGVLPLMPDELKYVAYLEVGKDDGKHFTDTLTEYYNRLDKFSIGSKPTAEEADSIRTLLEPYSRILVGYHSTDLRPQYNYGIDSTNLELINSLTLNKQVILDFFGLPYGMMQFDIDSFKAVIVSYDNSPEAQVQSARMLMGDNPASGKLPVSINPYYKEGFGLDISISYKAYNTK
ncbi:MAG: hypothetical protein LBG19_01935 [Prevotellaceae bacterium]|jgi:beta-glucosidase-like glycosyl hydrolase|nr:hypothetical protein [Prevotellaceae bacterium]